MRKARPPSATEGKGPLMILLPCVWCGPRDASEFAHVGETSARPDPGALHLPERRGNEYAIAEDEEDRRDGDAAANQVRVAEHDRERGEQA